MTGLEPDPTSDRSLGFGSFCSRIGKNYCELAYRCESQVKIVQTIKGLRGYNNASSKRPYFEDVAIHLSLCWKILFLWRIVHFDYNFFRLVTGGVARALTIPSYWYVDWQADFFTTKKFRVKWLLKCLGLFMRIISR